jgi:acetolactate synthase-1/3 small subunit
MSEQNANLSEFIPDVPEHNGFHKVVLELGVANHPGVMSHICNLFARRAFNVEGILCMPVGSARPAASGCWSSRTSASRR